MTGKYLIGAALLALAAVSTHAQSPATPSITPSAASPAAPSTVSAADQQFMIKAAQGGLGEVTLGTVAQRVAASDDVKQFGAQMVQDHSKANMQLSQLAAQKGIVLPVELGPEEQASKNRLTRLSGKRFDQAYTQDMLEDHQKDVADFQQEASAGQDPDVKAFAAQTLPTLQQHLQMVQPLAQKASGNGASK